MDDHSRFVIGLQILPGTKASPILAWLDECFELCGQPLQLMSDNGQPLRDGVPGRQGAVVDRWIRVKELVTVLLPAETALLGAATASYYAAAGG